MKPEKFVAFMEKLLERTKQGLIKWKRYEPDPQFEAWASEEKSFSCVAGTMGIDIVSDEDLETIEFNIRYDPNLPEVTLSAETDEERRIALRLVNYVYNLFPNLEKSIDEFLRNF